MERMKGQKRLCFIVPLLPNRTTLSVFNETDMTLSLTTSARRLRSDVDDIMHSNSSRLKDRVSHSKQAQWLKRGRTGTHVFIMKIKERSRALDWYWELWRDLGGELPDRIEVSVPALSTSIRIVIPKDDDQVGSKTVCHELSPSNTIKACWEMMGNAIDIQDLLDQRNDRAGELDLELAWKAIDGSLDWVAHRTTVSGKSRDWAVLAGIARLEVSAFRTGRPCLKDVRSSGFPGLCSSVPPVISPMRFVSKTDRASPSRLALRAISSGIRARVCRKRMFSYRLKMVSFARLEIAHVRKSRHFQYARRSSARQTR